MYAVIATGGKQEKVSEGQVLNVERLVGRIAGAAQGSEGEGNGVDGSDTVSFSPVLIVDGDMVMSSPQALEFARVEARIIDEVKGPKIRGFTYKNKSNQHRRWGHRQKYTRIEITSISTAAQ